MKNIQILGTGCAKCIKLTENAKKAAEEAGVACEIEKVTELTKIIDLGVMMTPALVIDGSVISSGKVLSKDEIKEIIAK